MTILDKIIAYKKIEVANKTAIHPIKLLEKSLYFNSDCVSLKEYIQCKEKSGIIRKVE